MESQRAGIFDLMLPISEEQQVVLGEATRADLDATLALLPESSDQDAVELHAMLLMFRAGLDDDSITVYESCTMFPGVQFVPEPVELNLEDWE
jgi:hypothetical protein